MSRWQVIRWWEIRRIPYNGLLFVIGLTSLLTMEWLMGKVIPVGEDAVEPFALAVGVVVYAIMANLCYTLGWIVELGNRNADEGHQRARAKRLFLAGLWFSSLLASLPFWFGLVFWLLHRNHQP